MLVFIDIEDHALSVTDDETEESSDKDEDYDVENAGTSNTETSSVQSDDELDSEEEFSQLDCSKFYNHNWFNRLSIEDEYV